MGFRTILGRPRRGQGERRAIWDPRHVPCSRGWFADTLTDANLPRPVALAFPDVDIVASVRDCLTALWPRLSRP